MSHKRGNFPTQILIPAIVLLILVILAISRLVASSDSSDSADHAPSVSDTQTETDTTFFEAQTFASTTVPGYYVDKASVTGITASASYTYQVGNEDGRSPAYSYQAPADTPDSLTFLVTADAQIGQPDIEDPLETAERWDSVLHRLTSYVPEANFLFHLGDQVADFGSEEHYGFYLNHLPLYHIALAPMVGNHDVANDYTIGAKLSRNNMSLKLSRSTPIPPGAF